MHIVEGHGAECRDIFFEVIDAKLFKRPVQMQAISGASQMRQFSTLSRHGIRRLWDSELLGGVTPGEVVAHWMQVYPGIQNASVVDLAYATVPSFALLVCGRRYSTLMIRFYRGRQARGHGTKLALWLLDGLNLDVTEGLAFCVLLSVSLCIERSKARQIKRLID